MNFLLRYKTKEDILRTFAPTQQGTCAELPEKCLMDDYPTLSDLKRIFGKETANVWIETMIIDLAEYMGIGKKLDGLQRREISRMFFADGYYLKLPELLLFFAYIKVGKYGKFYGTFDGVIVLQALSKFKIWRAEQIARYEQRQKEAARNHRAEGCCTREQYNAMKKICVPLYITGESTDFEKEFNLGKLHIGQAGTITIEKGQMDTLLEFERKGVVKIHR